MIQVNTRSLTSSNELYHNFWVIAILRTLVTMLWKPSDLEKILIWSILKKAFLLSYGKFSGGLWAQLGGSPWPAVRNSKPLACYQVSSRGAGEGGGGSQLVEPADIAATHPSLLTSINWTLYTFSPEAEAHVIRNWGGGGGLYWRTQPGS